MKLSRKLRTPFPFGLFLVILCCGLVAASRTNSPKIARAAGGSYQGELPSLGKVQLDLFLSGRDTGGWLYRDGTGLPDRVLIISNQNETVGAIVWQPKTDATNLILEFHALDFGSTLEGQAWNPDDGGSAAFKLTRVYEHNLIHKTGRQLGQFGRSKEFHGEFPFFSGNSPFEVATTQSIIEESLKEASQFTRTGVEEHFQNIRAGWGVYSGWACVDSLQWQCRLKTDEIASFAVWCMPDCGGCGNWTMWKSANYWWHEGRLEPFKLEDLFEDRERGDLRARRYCSEDFKQHEFLSGARLVLNPDVQFDAFTVSPTGVQVYFNPYKLSSGADGEFIVHIPYSVLQPFFRTNGPASALPFNAR